MIGQNELQRIGNRLETGSISEQAVSALRSEFPDRHFTYCMDDDVVMAKPVYEGGSFNLYLVDSSDHCLSLTNDPEVATGIVVAEIEM